MTPWDSIRAALGALRANPLRSALTTLGIMIGVAAVIIMVSIGSGAQAEVQNVIRSMGANLLIVLPGTSQSLGVRQGRGSRPTITDEDAKAIVDEIPSVQTSAPSIRGQAQFINGNLNWQTQVFGAGYEYMEAREWDIALGRNFTAEEVRSSAKVVLLGDTVVENLFPGENPVGRQIRVDRVPFTVIGTLVKKGQSPFGFDQDDTAIVPLMTARQRLLGGRWLRGNAVGSIHVKFRDAEDMVYGEMQVRELLRQRHRLRASQDDDFQVRNLSELAQGRATTTRVMTILLAAVASVSLLVGGIGIMNIMLVSVTERTREIGLRMAIGAESGDIRRQFLIEAVTLSAIGGVIGIGLGIAGANAVAAWAEWPTLIEPESIVVAFGFAALIGVFFGLYPAH
ncbi:MAG: ABC transporter permease, partial [Rhodospirillales bacterium]